MRHGRTFTVAVTANNSATTHHQSLKSSGYQPFGLTDFQRGLHGPSPAGETTANGELDSYLHHHTNEEFFETHTMA